VLPGEKVRPLRLSLVVGLPDASEEIGRFVLELLGTGSTLCELVSDLADALPVDAYPGEDPTHVVLEMVSGTIATALVSADPADVRRASELIRQARIRTYEHLRLAQALSRRLHADDADGGPSYG
jgi:hypothetical protein